MMYEAIIDTLNHGTKLYPIKTLHTLLGHFKEDMKAYKKNKAAALVKRPIASKAGKTG